MHHQQFQVQAVLHKNNRSKFNYIYIFVILTERFDKFLGHVFLVRFFYEVNPRPTVQLQSPLPMFRLRMRSLAENAPVALEKSKMYKYTDERTDRRRTKK